MNQNQRLAMIFAGALGGLAPAAAWAAPCGAVAGYAATETKCVTAMEIPGNPLRSYDISWVDSKRGEYYLGDRSNGGIDIFDTKALKFKRTITGFVGAKLKPNNTVDNQHSGPNGVVSHGRWLYSGDGDSTLKVIDLDDAKNPIKATISTGGKSRLDEMDLTTDGKFLIAANNAEDPTYATLFAVNGDGATNSAKIIAKTTVDPSILPVGAELSLEQPAWDPYTKRFYTSVPVMAENPPGCNYKDEKDKPVTCDGAVLVTDPMAPEAVAKLYDPVKKTGVIPLHDCGPNGATVGPKGNIMFGCTTSNNPSNRTTVVLNAVTRNQVNIGGVYGEDEIWYNKGDQRFYVSSSKIKGHPSISVIGVDNLLIEQLAVSDGSHSIAVDASTNTIFSPQNAPKAVVGPGGDTTNNGETVCGGKNGCIAVFRHGK